MVDNLTNLTTVKSFSDILTFTNNITDGVLGIMFMVVLTIMFLLMFLRRYTFEESLLAASFLSFVISFFTRAIGFTGFTITISLGIIMCFSGFWVYLSKK